MLHKNLKPAILAAAMFLALLSPAVAQEEEKSTALQDAVTDIEVFSQLQGSVNDGFSPLWLVANRYGLSTVKGNNAMLRAGIAHSTEYNKERKWRIGYCVDLALSTASSQRGLRAYIQQAYADFEYKWLRLSVGSKQRPMMMKDRDLSSGSQTFGINARPIPEVRIEVPEYVTLGKKVPWLALKGHFSYGMMTDGKWQRDYVTPGTHYVRKALYHSKAGFIRLGNEKKFPLTFEAGLEMACEFGGTAYNPNSRVFNEKFEKVKIGSSFKDFIRAIYGGGHDVTDGSYNNAKGNTLGSWMFRLNGKIKDWGLHLYYDHFFEDHSQLFMQYGWRDGLIGLQIDFPKNPVAATLVYEFINTRDQSGPIYHDKTDQFPVQMSGCDNYYNHNIYQGWQHWGQAIGNALYYSPLYNDNGSLLFTGNRFQAHHIGVKGEPVEGLEYRIMISHQKNWGGYYTPFLGERHETSWLCEVNYRLPLKSTLRKGFWTIGLAVAQDRGNVIGNHWGGQLSVSYENILRKKHSVKTLEL